MKHKLINFPKSKVILTAIILALTVCIFAGCSPFDGNERQDSLQNVKLPLELWEDKYLYGEIPAPEGADVYFLSSGTSGEWNVRAFYFENLSMEDSKEYISFI